MTRRWWMLILGLAWASVVATGCEPARSGQPPSVPVAVYDLPVSRVVTDYEEFPGSTEAIVSVQLRARVSGYMTQVYFRDGDLVEEGNLLFQIDPRQYKAELERAKGNVQQIEAHKHRLEKEYYRAKSLLSRGKMSQEEHDRYEADLKETEANLILAASNRDLAQLNSDWCEVRAPSSGLLSRRMVDPGNLIKADDTVLTSLVSLDPIYVYFDVHEQAMLRIMRLMREGKIKVRAQGSKEVPVQIALSDEPDYPHQGIVDFTDNRVDVNTGTLRFRAKLSNPPDHNGNRAIVPGLFVRVRLPISDPHPALLIREQALVSDQGQKGVFVIKEKDAQGKPFLNEKKQPVSQAAVWTKVVTSGVSRGGYVEIQEGVRTGDMIVVSGMQRMRNGREVKSERFAEAAPAPDANGATPAALKPAESTPAKEKAAAVTDPKKAVVEPRNEIAPPKVDGSITTASANGSQLVQPSTGAGDVQPSADGEHATARKAPGNPPPSPASAGASGNQPSVNSGRDNPPAQAGRPASDSDRPSAARARNSLPR